MKQIIFPFPAKGHGRKLPFFLATEEWAAHTLPSDCGWIFTWVVEPTVICGRNQNIALEVDLDYCRANGIDVVRRRSGGGCVYADGGNIMISHLCRLAGRTYEEAFGEYTKLVVRQLRSMGFGAEASGRNDVTVGGRKISGGAFYRVGDCAISHSTMLYDTDPVNMSHAITPSRAKLASNGVASVASRITTAHDIRPDMSFDEFYRGLVHDLAAESYMLTDSDIRTIEEIEQTYRRPSWLRVGEYPSMPSDDSMFGHLAHTL